MEDWVQTNRALWDERVPIHVASEFYDVDAFLAGGSSRAGLQAEFVEANVYDAVRALGQRRFDIVYTGIGAILWLPDIDRWASTMAELLITVAVPEAGRGSDVPHAARRRRAAADVFTPGEEPGGRERGLRP